MNANFKILLVVLVTLFVVSCSKDDNNNGGNNNGNTIEGITVTTIDITNVKTILASANSKVEVDATKATLTAKGIVWSTNTNPTISLTTKTVENNTTGNFQSTIADLQHSTTYYVRAYATDNKGNTVYGNEISFTTKVGWKMVKSNFGTVVGIKTDGTLWAWGYNNLGQIGDGSTTDKNMPVQIGTNNDWNDISIGDAAVPNSSSDFGSYLLAIKNDGSLWGWGGNRDGQIGVGTTNTIFLPTRVGIDNDWKQIRADWHGSLGLKNDGTLWWWGNGTGSTIPQKITLIDNVALLPISYNSDHIVVSKYDGTLWAWGLNQTGQVGNGTTIGWIPNPTKVSDSYNFSKIYTSQGTSYALTSNGILYAWGRNGGLYGDGTNVDKVIPTLNNNFSNCKMLATTGGWTLALKNDNTLWASGSINDQLGFTLQQLYIFNQVGTKNNWIYISSDRSRASSYAIQNNGSLWATGDNSKGQLGNGTTTNSVPFILVE